MFLRSYHNILHQLQLNVAGPLADILSRKNFDTIHILGRSPQSLTIIIIIIIISSSSSISITIYHVHFETSLTNDTGLNRHVCLTKG